MDLSTQYLGFTLPHPLIAGASPLADDLDNVKRLEDAGASALVLRSLFEEQITNEQMAEHFHLDAHAESFAEATSYFPGSDAFALGTEQYLEHLRDRRCAHRARCGQSHNGGRTCHSDGLRAAGPRPLPHPNGARRSRRMAAGTRLEFALRDARQPESPEGARCRRIRTGELYAHAPELARLITFG